MNTMQTAKHLKLMESGQGVKVRISEGRASSEGEVRVQFWNKRERTLRALKLLAMCWGCAITCIIIPLLHFVLVPGLLIAGPILAFFTLGQESVILGGEGICPHCQLPLPIARAPYRFPLSDLCTGCQTSVKIELAPI